MSKDPFSDDAASDFLEGAATAAKWPTVGYVVEADVTGWSMMQQLDYDSSEPLFWNGKKRTTDATDDDGNKRRPVMQLRLDVQLDEPTFKTWEGLDNTEVDLPDDDGARSMYVKGGLQAALKTALKQAGGKLEMGARVRVERIKDGPKSNPKFRAPYRFSAKWTKASENPRAAHALLADDDDDDNPFG